MRAFHGDRFGAQAHELRGRTGWPGHGVRAVSHERLHHASRGGVHVEPALVWPVQREPKSQPRHAQAGLHHRLPAYQAGVEPASHASQRTHQQGHHSRTYIHARHLARVHYGQELRQYHLELRQWRHLLVERERLLRKLASLERRLARQAKQPARRVAGETYEIDGTWFRAGSRPWRRHPRPPFAVRVGPGEGI